MASGERRLGSGRRGMTVLGKIPTPSVPKPINLPSQRLENRGIESNVDIVPRGTFSWGSAGRSNAVAVGKEGVSNIGSSPPTSTVAWNGTVKMQAPSASSNDAGNLAESRPLSAGSTRPSSAPTAATTTVWGSGAKTKVEMQGPLNVLTVNPVEPGSQEKAGLTPQQKNVILSRPTTADGTILDRHTISPPGVDAHASPSSQPGSGSQGFQHPGNGYNSQGNHQHLVWQGMPPAGGRELPVVPGPYTGPLPHEMYYSPYGVPQYGNVKDRDMVVVRMVNGPGVYGSFPPHFRPAECFGPPGTYGNYQPAARQIEHPAMSGNSAMGTSSCTPVMSFGFFPDCNKYSSQEDDEQFGSMPRDAGYPSMQRSGDSVRHISSVPAHGNEWKHRMRRPVERQSHANEEHGTHTKDGVATLAMPAPEKKITLLTKMPRVEALSTETSMNSSTMVPDSSQGNEGGQQKTEKSIVEAENASTVLEVEDIKNADESLESNNLDEGVKDMTRSDTMTEVKPDVVAVICNKGMVSEVDTTVSKTFSSRSPKTWRKAACRSEVNGLSSAQKSLPSRNTKDSERKMQTSHYFNSDDDSLRYKFSKQGHEGTHLNAISDFTGTGSEGVSTEPTRPGVEENLSSRDDQKTKTKALNHKSEKEWRPKSPVVESKFSGHRIAKGGKKNEQGFIADSFKDVLSQDYSTGSIVSEASSPSQTRKADRRRGFKNQEKFSRLANPDIDFDNEAALHLIEDPNSSQSQVVEATSDPIENGRTCVLDASYSGAQNTARSDCQVLLADTSEVMITEGLILKGSHKPKMRQSNHKGEKEWRPKSPVVDSLVASDNVSGNQASKANVNLTFVSDIDIQSIHELKPFEQEGLQPLDAYDYEGQRAKLKEIAAQRAKQRRKEEEERIREQRAKALAKLDELNRRTLTNPTSVEGIEHGSKVCMDEAPNRKTKRKFNPSRHSSADVLTSDAGGLIKQHDEIDQVPVKDAMSISTTTLPKKYLAKDMEESPRNDVTFPQNSRSNRDELADRNSSKTAGKHQLHEFQTATSSLQEQKQQSRKEKWITEEDLPSAVYDTQMEPSSSKNSGAELRKDKNWLQRGRRQIDLTQDQIDKAPLIHRNQRSAAEEHQEAELSNLSTAVPQIGDSQDKGGLSGKRRSQENIIGGPNQTKVGELTCFEGHPSALGSVERKTNTHAGERKQSSRNSRFGQKNRSEIDVCLASEEAQSLGIKQPMEATVSSDSSVVSEKPSKAVVSWRQKNPSHSSNTDKLLNVLSKDMGSALEESEITSSQDRKSPKFKSSGGKEHAISRHQEGHIQVEKVEEKRPSIPCAVISKITTLNVELPKHEVEAKGSENVKNGRSHNSRRQKNNASGSYMVKQTSIKEFNERHSESWAATETIAEMADSMHLHETSTSNVHYPIGHMKQSLRAGVGTPPWHKHRSTKLSNATVSPGQAESLVLGEERSPGQRVAVSRNRSRSNMANTQGWETEHLQEAESLPLSSQSRKGGAQFQAERTLPLEVSAQNQKHQQVYSAKGTDIVPDHGSKSRSNHTRVENRKMNKLYQAGPQTFRPREQHHEAVFEGGNNCAEQHEPSRGRDKPTRKSQFNGCSTAAEFDRRGAEPAIKTEISY